MGDTRQRIFTLYAVSSFIVTAFLPLLVWFPFFSLQNAAPRFMDHNTELVAFAVIAVLSFLAGWFWATAAPAPLPDSLFARLMPLFLPPLLLPLGYIPYALVNDPVPLSFTLGIILLILGGPWCYFYTAFLIRSERLSRSTAKMRGTITLLGVILLCTGSAAATHYIVSRNIVRPGNEASVGHGVDTWNYKPFSENNLLVKPASPPSLRIESGHPRLDGAIGSYPLYAAFAQAVYAGLDETSAYGIVNCTNTVWAYESLADGEVDIFFGMAPSREQRDYAASKGLTLTELPIGKEAFVFFVHKDNPVRSLTQAQIRAIYSGRIRNWKELGGPDEDILAFQRPEGSGSQTTMLGIMAGETMINPLRQEMQGMGDIILAVAEYRNRKNALGYSFRWYATVLFANPDIRLLAIDGIEPTPENIRSGIYPFTVYRLAVTARPLSPQSKSLLDWITGPEGQDLLERVGYVPLR